MDDQHRLFVALEYTNLHFVASCMESLTDSKNSKKKSKKSATKEGIPAASCISGVGVGCGYNTSNVDVLGSLSKTKIDALGELYAKYGFYVCL